MPSPKELELAKELDAVATRLIERVFESLYGQGPISAPTLFRLVQHSDPEAWQISPVLALRTAIRRAASGLGMRVKGCSRLTYEQAITGLFNLDGADLDHVEGSRYAYLFNQTLTDEAARSGDKRPIADDVRLRLAKELLSMASGGESVSESSTGLAKHAKRRVAAQAIASDPQYIPRQALHDRFIELVESGAKLIAAVGLPGMGKTWFAREVIRSVSDSPPIVVRSSDTGLSGRDLQGAFDVCGIDPSGVIGNTIPAYLARLLAHERAPDFLLLDNLESAGELGQLLPGQYRSTVVATCRRADDRPPGCAVIEVGKMTPAESNDLVRSRLKKVSAEDAAALASMFDNCPLDIDHACRMLAVQEVPVPDFCHDLRGQIAEFSAKIPTGEANVRRIVVLRSLAKDLQAKSIMASEFLLFLVHAGHFERASGQAVPQGLLIEALNWRYNRAIRWDEFLAAMALLRDFFYLETGPAREYRKIPLDSVQLHPTVSDVLFSEVVSFEGRAIAAPCLVRAAMTYAGRPEVRKTYGEDFLRADLAAINAGTLNTIAALLGEAESRVLFERFDADLRYEIELWFCFHVSILRRDDGQRLPERLELALSHVDETVASLSGKPLVDEYRKLHRRFILESFTKTDDLSTRPAKG